MCRRWATSARDRPWRSRSAASVWPTLRGAAVPAVSATDSTLSGLAFEQLLRLGQVGEAPAQLLQVALLRGGVAVGARDLHAHHQRLERGLRGKAHVAQEIVLRVLHPAALHREHRQVVERADEIWA